MVPILELTSVSVLCTDELVKCRIAVILAGTLESCPIHRWVEWQHV